jgi:hypothetical protein
MALTSSVVVSFITLSSEFVVMSFVLLFVDSSLPEQEVSKIAHANGMIKIIFFMKMASSLMRIIF